MRDRSRLTRQNLGWLLAKASQRWNELLAERFREAGYPGVRPAYGAVLVPLFEEDGLRIGELARRSGLSKQAMTSLVRAVEAVGLVVRERDSEDGRASRVSLTERGEALRPVAENALSELTVRVRTTLSEDERDALVAALRKVVEL